MKRIKDVNQSDWVISRIRNSVVELVHVPTGHLTKIDEAQLTTSFELLFPMVNSVPFAKRSRNFLYELRCLRRGAMLAKARAAKNAAIKRDAKAANKPTTRRPVGKVSTRVNAQLQQLLAKYPPEQHAALIAMMKGQV